MEVEYARRGVANAGLTTGIIGTALGALNGLGGMVGGRVAPGDCGVSHYELTMEASMAQKDAEIALLKSNTYNDQKMIEMYKYIDGELKGIRSELCQQAVVNAQVTANLSCMQQTINTLAGLTKTVIPISSICPEVMQRYNSWVAPTTPAATT